MESLYITKGGSLFRRGHTIMLVSAKGNDKEYFPIEQIEDIHVMSKVRFNSALLEFLTKKRVPMHFYNYFGHYVGSYYPKEYLVSGHMLVKQTQHYAIPHLRLEIAKNIVLGAMRSKLFVLKDRFRKRQMDVSGLEEMRILESEVERISSVEELMGVEGTYQRMYLKKLDDLIDDETFKIGTRTKHPPMSPGNTLMSFLNSMVYSTVLTQIYHTHLDPRIGYLHETAWRRFALSLDIAEIFKPLVADRLLLSLVSQHVVRKGHFTTKSGPVLLTADGKRKVARAYTSFVKSTIYHPKLRRKVSWKYLMRLEVFRLEKHLLGDDRYVPFKFPL